MNKTKYVVIVQCQLALKKCSGFACTNSFYNREGMFESYDNNTQYLSFDCGGCCGKSVSSKLMHFTEKLLKKTEIKKDEVIIHLSSCMTTDNYHYDRCPHIDYIKNIINKRSFTMVEGTYISKTAEKKRMDGRYKTY